MTQFNTAFGTLQSGKPIPPADPTGSVISVCAKMAAEFVWAEISGNKARADELQDEIRNSDCDPLWSSALAAYLAWKDTLKPVPYQTYKNLSDYMIRSPIRASWSSV